MDRIEQLAANRFCRTCFVQGENEKFSEIIDTTSQMELLSIANIEVSIPSIYFAIIKQFFL